MLEPYNEAGAFSTESAAKKLTEEERELVSEARKRTMKPMEFEEAIAYAVRRKIRNDSPTRRMGPTVGKVMRQFAFWEGKGRMDDGSIYKAVPELAVEIKLSERQTRTALEVGMQEGMLTRRFIIRPSDRRRVYSYLCDPVRTLRVACYGRLKYLHARLTREGRPKHAAKLERDVEGVEATLRDLDEWFGPEEARVSEDASATEQTRVPEKEGWILGESAPPLSDEDAPEPKYEDLDWLSDPTCCEQEQPSTTLNSSDASTAAGDAPATTADTSRPLHKRTTEEDAEETPLQGGDDGSSSRAASLEEDEPPPGPSDNSPHSLAALPTTPPPPKLSREDEHRVHGEIFGLVGDGEVRLLSEQYLDGEPVTVEQIARKVREKIGGEGSVAAHAAWVSYCLEGQRTGVSA